MMELVLDAIFASGCDPEIWQNDLTLWIPCGSPVSNSIVRLPWGCRSGFRHQGIWLQFAAGIGDIRVPIWWYEYSHLEITHIGEWWEAEAGWHNPFMSLALEQVAEWQHTLATCTLDCKPFISATEEWWKRYSYRLKELQETEREYQNHWAIGYIPSCTATRSS